MVAGLTATLLPAACDATPFVANMTLGPLGIDYVHIHMCLLSGMPLVSFLLVIVWLATLFYLLGSTADGYFSPTLASLSDRLGVPHDVAGVTFLAFGNGAPDVFSAIAAYNSNVSETGVNELLGGAMFISTVVVGGVAAIGPVKVQQWAFLRDMGALLASLLLFLLLASSNNGDDVERTAVSALMFLGMYGIYVGSVVLSAFVASYNEDEANVPDSKWTDQTNMMIAAFWHALSPKGNDARRMRRMEHQGHHYAFIPTSEAESNADQVGGGKQVAFTEAHPSSRCELTGPRFSSRVYTDYFGLKERDLLSSPLIANGELDLATDGDRMVRKWQQHMRWRWRLRRHVARRFTSDEPFLVKIVSIPQSAFDFLRDITVPLLDQESWSRLKACLSPITVPILVAAVSGYTNVDICRGRFLYRVPVWQSIVVVGGCASAIMSFVTHRLHAPQSLLASSVLLCLAFVACVCWIYAVANELMALLAAVGYITHASNSLLGLTVLAWGNSIGDLITDVSVARAGFPQMAMAGCIGGPVCNILLGLGLPMAFAFVSGRNESFALDAHAWISIVFLFVSLTSTLLVFGHNAYSCPAWYGKVLVVYYCIYSLLNLVVAVGMGPTNEN
ncbi:hypothetical protein PsorP6_005308 [Peronosclerospora sorghi]|uniref:Uncharacterized protein n=1 Tax=Peronosclerospora sorghi TaxID=230839 RepID=A0ACC0W504_9STRA|nr:hypothetical protein PsorP6_005308 [Peronosclerospora sorghi]